MYKSPKLFVPRIPLHSVNISECNGMCGTHTRTCRKIDICTWHSQRGGLHSQRLGTGRRAPPLCFKTHVNNKALPASAVSNSYRIRHFHTIAHPVSRNGSPERSPLPPRVVPVTGYTGLCADCLRAAVTSHGSRRRAASGSSSRHRRTSDESFMRTLAQHASRRL